MAQTLQLVNRMFSWKAPSVIILGLVLLAGCTLSTPIVDDDASPSDDASPDSDAGPSLRYETCELEDTEHLDADSYTIQIRNPECDTTICLHYNLETFCTIRCETDDDCRDIGQGLCEFDIFVGDPEFIGTYCVPRAVAD